MDRLPACTNSQDQKESLEKIESILGSRMEKSVIVHTDFGMGALIRLSRTVVCLDGPDDGLVSQFHDLLREPTHRSTTVVRLGPKLPEEFVFPKRTEQSRALIFQDGEIVGEASSVDDLRNLLATLSRGE